jgi:hypothetical protein
LKQFALGAEWKNFHAVTLRWRIYNTAGKLIRHAEQIILKITGGGNPGNGFGDKGGFCNVKMKENPIIKEPSKTYRRIWGGMERFGGR